MRKRTVMICGIGGLLVAGVFLSQAVFKARVAARRTQDR